MAPTISGGRYLPGAKGLMGKERGIIKRIAKELLYRVGGLSGTEIGEMMGVDYGTVSLGRKRIREKLKGDEHLSPIIKRIEADLSIIFDPFCSSYYPSGCK